jgi:hypothetical protein
MGEYEGAPRELIYEAVRHMLSVGPESIMEIPV